MIEAAIDKYQLLFNAINEGICLLEVVFNKNGTIKDLLFREQNKAFDNRTGLGNVVGKTVRDLLPDLEQHWIDIYTNILKTGEPGHTENYFKDADRWYSVRFQLLDDNGKYVAVTFTDIPERNKLLALMPIAIYTCDTEGRITFYNKRAAELWGREPKLNEDHDKFCGSLPGKSVRNMEVVIERPDGSHIIADLNIDPLYNDSGRLVGTINVLTDVSKQKRMERALLSSEERMRALKEVYQSVINGATINDSLRLLGNMAIKETHGLASTVFLIDDQKYPTGVGDKKDYAGCWSFPIKTSADKVVGTFTMYFNEKRDPTEKDLELGNTVTGTAAVIISNHSDKANRTRVEKLLKEMNAQLKDMNEAKTNFFNSVSSEFRTPLTLLIGPLEEVIQNERSGFNEQDLQKIKTSHRSAIRLQKLVNTLLDFARIEAGKLEAFYQPTDFAKVTIELVSNFRSAIEKAGIRFVVKSEPINEPIYLNREMWEKIVSNLLSNAFKFTHNGKIEVTIRSKKKNVELRVKDTGIGIAQKNLDRIFERFTRIETNHARTFEGMGIGLALVRELVHANGGAIKVKSKENLGSEFIVAIPKGKDHLPRQQIYETKESLSGDALTKTYLEEISGWRPDDEKLLRRKEKKYQREGAQRVLIAEDNADMRDYLTRILSEDKYEILALADGQKVLTFLRGGGDADLILAEVMMPVVDGYDLVQWLKNDPKFQHIPIVLLSARANEESKIEGLKVGADDYLVKPFSAKELRAVIKAKINKKGSQ